MEASPKSIAKTVGMILAVDPADADKTIEAIKSAGEDAFVIGQTVAGEKGVTLC